MSREINIDEDIKAQFIGLRGKWRCGLALDPGNGSSGWALYIDGKLLSGQGKPEDVVDHVHGLLLNAGVRCIDCLVVEDPFFIGAGNAWKLAWCAGGLQMAFRNQRRKDGVFWRPKPTSWRSVLGLNVSTELNEKGKPSKDRKAIERLVHAWVAERTRLPMRVGGNGAIEADRCNAVAMLYAALAITKSCAPPMASSDVRT